MSLFNLFIFFILEQISFKEKQKVLFETWLKDTQQNSASQTALRYLKSK